MHSTTTRNVRTHVLERVDVVTSIAEYLIIFNVIFLPAAISAISHNVHFEKHCYRCERSMDSSEKAIDSTDDRLQPIKCFVLASQTNRNVTIFFSKLEKNRASRKIIKIWLLLY